MSSPYAVSTERGDGYDRFSTYKEYIRIRMDIEDAFETKLKSAKAGDIMFLCGSSGDGKSEILTKYSRDYKATRDFHLDATHSFKPTQNAIQALDERFTSFKASSKPMVVGINIGMLGNYAEEGSEQHSDIKNSIKAFLEGNVTPENHHFLDFEQFPKFSLGHDENTSKFAAEFLAKLTRPIDTNPFFLLYKKELEKKGHTMLTTNFALLSLPSVQKSIVILLLKARLIKDQFLTARALLDFVFQLLTQDKYLFDSVFAGGKNELLRHIQSFDPSNLHTQKLDEFVLQLALGIEEPTFLTFKEKAQIWGIYGLDSAASYIRMMYLLKGESELNCPLVASLKSDFESDLLEKYASIWLMHREFEGNTAQENALVEFYEETLISAIRKYCNRNCPSLEEDVFYISQYNGFTMAAELEVEPCFEALTKRIKSSDKISHFTACLEVDGKELNAIPVSVNLLDLLEKINQGYRPNKHDKNAVLLLDEIAEQIVSMAKGKNSIHIFKGDWSCKVTNKRTRYQVVGDI